MAVEAVVSNGDPDGAWHLIQELGEDRVFRMF